MVALPKLNNKKSDPKKAAAKSPWPWLVTGLDNITQEWGEDHGYGREVGVDMGLVMGTPITSLTSGTILGSGYYRGGGVVSVKSRINGKTTSLYYQHLDEIAGGITPGAVVAPGQLIGWSGGQNAGGHHPASKDTSSGPHIEVGFNAPYGAKSLWHPLGPNYDPLPWLRSMAGKTSAGPSGAAGQLNQQARGHIPGFIQVCIALDQIEQFKPWSPPAPNGQGLSNPIVGALLGGGAEDLAKLNPSSQIAVAVGGVGDTLSYWVGWVAGNSMAAFVRGLIVLIGVVCLLLVLAHLINGISQVVVLPGTPLQNPGSLTFGTGVGFKPTSGRVNIPLP